MTDHLLIEKNGGIATLTMNRPEARNALSIEMRTTLYEAMIDIETDDDIRCVVIKGAGEHFMAGGDVKSFRDFVGKEPDERRKIFEKRIHTLTPTMIAMRRMKKPIIASVRGAAAGFGLSLAMACDMVIASDSSFYTLAYINIGATPDGSGSYSLPRIVGLKKAMEIAMLGDRFGADEAKQLGLINFVTPDADLDAETDKLAARLASGPTVAIGRTKELMHASMVNDLEKQLSMEAEGFSNCAATEDWAEAITAFSEKRKPVFKGK
jgi:2-(1,2-epoxy-1,2-dihydrophenyl)acetyl-CoA isomerase